MEKQALTGLVLEETSSSVILRIQGEWVLTHYLMLEKNTQALKGQLPADIQWDIRALIALDTAGAFLLVDLLGEQRLRQLLENTSDLIPQHRLLLDTLCAAVQHPIPSVPSAKTNTPLELLNRIGLSMEHFWCHSRDVVGFMGLTLESLVKTLFRPSRWRITPLVANLEQVGLNAVPIVTLLTFLVGAVIAFLGATVLATFGATVFTVNLVVFSFLREFAVLLTAILLAGRTASAFTAQIGLMKANEELDALQALGLNPVELLVLPRVLALLIALPILTFIGVLSGIAGGMTVCALALDISPTMFVSIMEGVEVRHFLVGLSKAPIFAFLIAVIGCLQGFRVTGSAASVGQHTTASVVHSIFIVILLDAIAALFFMEMGW